MRSPNGMRFLKEISFVCLFLLACSSAAFAQQVRDGIWIDTTSTGSATGPSLDTEGDLGALAYCDGGPSGSNTVNVSVSDGRGTEWTAPVRVDEDFSSGQSKFTRRDSVQIVGDHIYVVWQDERFGSGADVLYFKASHDRGQTWEDEIRLDKAHPVNDNPVRDWCVKATRGANQILIYVLFTVDAGGHDDIHFVASHNSGASFYPAIPVSSWGTGQFDVDAIALVADGADMHVFWQDNRRFPYDDVYYQRSETAGYTWLTDDVQIDSSGPYNGDANEVVVAAIAGDVIIVGWLEELTDPYNNEARINVSADGGDTWRGDIMVGNYDPFVDEIGGLTVSLNATNFGTALLAAWHDDRVGDKEVFVTSSDDLGATWRNEFYISKSGGKNPAFARRPYHGRSVAITWVSGEYPNSAEVGLSRDFGASWVTNLSASPPGGEDVEEAYIDFNHLYDNYICTWLAGPYPIDNLFAGGFRDQTLLPQGMFHAGQVTHFEVENWPTREPYFCVLIAGFPGSYTLPFGDGRETGLGYGPFMQYGFSLISTILGGPLAADGSGQTVPFYFPNSPYLPPGTIIYCIGLSFDTSTVPTSLGPLSDVVEITVV